MRRVLLIAANFPPTANVSAHRPGKYAKYLPKFGWEPVVLTRRDAPYGVDPSLAEGIEARVHRAGEAPLRTVMGLIARVGLHDWVSLPDDQYAWTAAVVSQGTKLLRELSPDAILCSCVPLASAVGAALLRRSQRVPLVLDFHNEWTKNMYFDPPTALHAGAQERLEEWVVGRADAVVTLNPMHTEDYRKRFSEVPILTIQNGYDPEDFADLPPPTPAKGRRVVFTYAGAIYGYQSPRAVIEAIEKLGLRDEVEVRVLGDPFRGYQGPDWVKVERDLPHAEMIRRFGETDYFFLGLEAAAARQLPAKLYEYLAARRPTLAVVPPDGAAAALLAETGGGVVTSDPGPVIADWVRAAREGRPVCEFLDEAIRAFEREKLVGRLAGFLDRVSR